jgi:hypothetical protein
MQRDAHAGGGEYFLGFGRGVAAVLKRSSAAARAALATRPAPAVIAAVVAAGIAVAGFAATLIAAAGIPGPLVAAGRAIIAAFVEVGFGFEDLRGGAGASPRGPEEKLGQQTGGGISFRIAHGAECSD